MQFIGFIIIGICVFVPGWIFWTLVLFPNGRKKSTKQVFEPRPVPKATEKPQNTEAMDRLWFFDPKTKALVEKARNELPLLYSKMQVLQQRIVGEKVDANRSEGTLLQGRSSGMWALDLAVACVSANDLRKANQKQDDIQSEVEKLQKQIDEDEAIVARYDNLSVRFARG